MKILLKSTLLLALLWTVAASSQAVPIRVFAASSLTEAFGDIGAAYLRLHRSDPAEYSFAGAPTLRTQIQEGALVDVFASDDRQNVDALAAQRLVGPKQIFARNTMLVVVPAKSPRVIMINELSDKGVRVVLADTNVPAGHYAEQVLVKMTPGIQDNFAKRVLANVVSRVADVRDVLAKVARGEADAGIVFATDVTAAGQRVRTIPIRPEYNVIGEYAIAPLTRSRNPRGADSFIKFVMSSDGQAILRAHGFLSAGGLVSPPAGQP